jgi:hypothetical protein
MNLTVTLQLDNMPDDTDPEVVGDVVRRQVNEWLDFDWHPQDVHLSVEKTPCQPTA